MMKVRFAFSIRPASHWFLAGCLALTIGAWDANQARAEVILKFATVQAPNSPVVTQCLTPIAADINKAAGSEFKI